MTLLIFSVILISVYDYVIIVQYRLEVLTP